ncbi:protein VTE6, chloroplastic [Physcomitrium patens]|uniref:TIGR00297 family protein n=1 Tax=Physcomitrium patens TaxID=3218 RepID=A9SRH2_PHYPA|nr:protein VTE6, chloroplastic-like [Physcomitrium patens]PNR42102.1 hypothetical protein PHYPA_016931 [Physcomitrium patens]|eukprot:XP_024392744.1 protein VTE6, chloroplastic-like [Physcomitrella patens]
MATLDVSESFRAVLQGVQRALRSPASWESTIIATTTIFVIAAPVLLVGLSIPGVMSAFLLGLFTFRAFGLPGTVIVFLYFLIGTAATKVNYKLKKAEGTAEKRGGRRGPGSVWGSGTAGTLCAIATICGVFGPAWVPLWRLGFLASFCTKLSDTMGSEIGKAFGRTTYLVTTMTVVPRGTDGAVSLVGTFAGLIASVFLAFIGYVVALADLPGAIICVGAAQVANLCESFIGAALQGQKGTEWITNDVSNIFNISIGASLAILTSLLFR